MPYVNAWEPAGVTTHFTGHVSASEYLRSAEEICAHADFDTLRFVIKDLLEIEGHSILPGSVENIAALRLGARLTNPNIYLVFITKDPGLVSFAMPDPKSLLRDIYHTQVFADRAQARAWLAAQRPLSKLVARLRR